MGFGHARKARLTPSLGRWCLRRRETTGRPSLGFAARRGTGLEDADQWARRLGPVLLGYPCNLSLEGVLVKSPGSGGVGVEPPELTESFRNSSHQFLVGPLLRIGGLASLGEVGRREVLGHKSAVGGLHIGDHDSAVLGGEDAGESRSRVRGRRLLMVVQVMVRVAGGGEACLVRGGLTQDTDALAADEGADVCADLDGVSIELREDGVEVGDAVGRVRGRGRRRRRDEVGGQGHEDGGAGGPEQGDGGLGIAAACGPVLEDAGDRRRRRRARASRARGSGGLVMVVHDQVRRALFFFLFLSLLFSTKLSRLVARLQPLTRLG